MAYDRDSMALRFHELFAEKNRIRAVLDEVIVPLRAERDALEAAFDKAAAEIDAKIAAHREANSENLAEIKSEMAIITRALDGKTALA